MKATVQDHSFKSPKTHLREVLYLVRTGLPTQGTLSEQQERTRGAIRNLKRRLHAEPDKFDAVDKLRLVTLEAEFQQYCGQFQDAAGILEPTWKLFKPQLDNWSKVRPLGPKGNRELLRQRIWALMTYVYLADYLIAGNHQRAMSKLLLLRNIIEAELETKENRPFGTLALCHYFMGRCQRVNREFQEAEDHFVLAQRYLYERADRELKRQGITAREKSYELAFKDVFTARILAGLARVTMQRGQLLRAEQALRSANTLLLNTHHELLKYYVRSLLWTAVRRRTAYGEPEYERTLNNLMGEYRTAGQIYDIAQQERCGSEIARGFLDLLEFSQGDEDERSEYFRKAEVWLERAELRTDLVSRQRQHLLRARFHLLKGDIEASESDLQEAESAAASNVRQRGMPITRAALHMHRQEWDAAAKALKAELNQLQPFGEKMLPQDHRISDPLLEAQCYVVLAQIYASRRNHAEAQLYFGKWESLSQFVDNHYLKHLASKIITTEMPYLMAFEFAVFGQNSADKNDTVESHVKRFEAWLLDSINNRYPDLNREELAEAVGTSRSTVTRRFGSKPRKNKKV